MNLFGKLAPKPHRCSLNFADLWGGEVPLPLAPPKRAWEYHPQIEKVGWGMYGNDVCSDCTLASKAHIIMAATANAGSIVVPSQDEITGIYKLLSGWNGVIGDPSDTGLVMTDVYDYWLKNPIAGQKLLGWVKIDHTNRAHFEQCVNLFSACDVGVQFPQSAEVQFANNEPWDWVDDPSGDPGPGHNVPYMGYGSQGETCISWGRRVPCGLTWFPKYADEGYGLILDGWFDTAGKSPVGFDRDALWKALQALKAS